jgi:hypothetical protein
MQGESVNCLERAVGFAGLIVFPPSSGFAQIHPVGGPITGPCETGFIYKGLDKIEGMVKDAFPV